MTTNYDDAQNKTLPENHDISDRDALTDKLSQMVVGGLLGAYIKEGFPLYYISDTMLSYLGFSTKQEFIDKTGGLIANQMHPEDRADVWQSVNEQIAAGGEYVVEYRYKKTDGTFLWVHDVGKAVTAANGELATTSICYDITEQKNLRQKLADTTRDMKAIIDNIPGGVVKFMMNDKGIFPVYISDRFCSMMNDTRENMFELYGKDCMAGLHPDDYERVSTVVSESMRQGKAFSITYRICNKNGVYRWVNNSSSHVCEEDGKTYYYAVYTDVTEEMNTKLKAEQYAKETELLYNTIPGAVFKCRFNYDWDVIFANDGLFRFLGYTREEFATLFNNKMLGVIHPEDGKIMVDKIANQLKYSTTVKNENRLICKGGIVKWISIHAQLLVNETGEKYFHCTFVDITDQKSTEIELKNTQRELRALIKNIPGGVFKYDADSGRFEYISPYMLSMLGYTQAEFDAKFDNKFSNIIYIDDRERVLNEISKQTEINDTDHCEYRIETKSGELMWVYDVGFKLKQGGRSLFYVVIVDISAKKKADTELARAQEKLSLALNHAGLGFWEYDIKNSTAYLNSVMTEQYNLPAVRKPYPQTAYEQGTIAKESIDNYGSLVDEVKRGNPLVVDDIKTIDKNGHYVWKRVHYTTLFDKAGKPYWAIATAQTVDDYKTLEQQFSIAAEQTGVDVWIFDIHKKTMTRTAAATNEYSSIKLIKNVPQRLAECGLVHPDDISLLYDIFLRLENGESRISETIRLFNKALNDYTYHKADYTLILDKSGKPDRAICTDVDITKQIILERQYQEAIDLYRSSLKENALLSGYCNITHNRLLSMTSGDKNNYAELYAGNRDAFFTALSKIVCDAEKQKEITDKFLSAPLIKAYAKGISEQSTRCKVHFEDGRFRYVEMTVKILKNPASEELTGFFSMIDITKDMIYQRAVNISFEKYCEMVLDIDVIDDSYKMLVIPTTTNDILPTHGVFSGINKGFAKTLADKESVKECSRKLSIAYMTERLKNEESYWFYYRIYENGTLCSKKLQVFYIDKELGHIGLIRTDVTAALEEEKKKNEALSIALTSSERANRAKSDFLSRMSHDIRTPMNAIIGMTELTKQELDDKDKVLENIKVIDSSSKLLLNIINDVLDMSQIESGKMTIAKEPFDSLAEGRKVIEIANVMFKKKHQKFEIMNRITHTRLIGDAVRLKRVVINLLNNASKYTPEHGIISLTAAEEKHPNPQFTTITFSVVDNGIGIPADKLDDIFIPFEQLDMNIAREGSGLGLPIVKSIVESQGGTITVESTVGKGSTFTVKIPMRICDIDNDLYPTEENDNATDSIDFSRLHALLVEDHPVNTTVAKRLLEKHGATVDTAQNGSIGYDKFTQSKEGTYNIIFMDIQMPVMNGYEATTAIRESNHPQAKYIPIIAMTANAFTEDIQKSLSSGMNGHIAKPISIEEIAKEVGKVMKNIQNKSAQNGG